MPVAADLEVQPSLDEVRALAAGHTVVPLRHTFISDTETPVSAYLRLRGEGPSFLLESAERGQRFGRWSFLGVQPRTVIRLQAGVLTIGGEPREFDDPYAAVAEELDRYSVPPLADLPPFAGGAVGMFGYDLVRSFEPSVGEPSQDDLGLPDLALMVSDVLLAFDHLRHEVTVLANVFVDGGDLETSYEEAVAAIADVRERLAAPIPRAAAGVRSRRSSRPTSARRGSRPPWRRPRSTSAPVTSTRWCRASGGAPTPPLRPSRSIAACARSTRALTCTSSTSRTSSWRAPRPSRS